MSQSMSQTIARIIENRDGLPSVLSVHQSKILLAFLSENHPLGSVEITRLVKISSSSWAKEKKLLVRRGLLTYSMQRTMTENGIMRKFEYSLTKKGKRVAQALLCTSMLLGNQD